MEMIISAKIVIVFCMAIGAGTGQVYQDRVRLLNINDELGLGQDRVLIIADRQNYTNIQSNY